MPNRMTVLVQYLAYKSTLLDLQQTLDTSVKHAKVVEASFTSPDQEWANTSASMSSLMLVANGPTTSSKVLASRVEMVHGGFSFVAAVDSSVMALDSLWDRVLDWIGEGFESFGLARLPFVGHLVA